MLNYQFGIPNIIGLIGATLILLAFLFLQAGKLDGNGVRYQIMNLFGSLAIVVSLVFEDFNLPSLILETAWAGISVFGIIRSHKEAHRVGSKD